MIYTLNAHEQFTILSIEKTSLTEAEWATIHEALMQLIMEQRSCLLNGEHVVHLDVKIVDSLMSLHDEFYANNLSFVLCSFDKIDKQVLHADKIQIAPTEIEGIDIICMEVIERELLDGE
ncbi:MAG: hypothetical protein R2831_12980 [Chitinophagaceae bacterium]